MQGTRIPAKEECVEILKKHNTPSEIIQHCLLVTRITEEFCSKIKDLNIDVVIAGAMLHDIGRSADHSIAHAINGVRILQKENIDPRIISIVKNHIGTGIAKEEAEKLGLPSEDYFPLNAEEIIVSYSDNLACGTQRSTFEKTLQDFTRKFGGDSHVVKGLYRQKRTINKMITLGVKIKINQRKETK